MTDIVERLRGAGSMASALPACREAADEIERLYAENSHWKRRHDTVLQKHIECCGAAQQTLTPHIGEKK